MQKNSKTIYDQSRRKTPDERINREPQTEKQMDKRTEGIS